MISKDSIYQEIEAFLLDTDYYIVDVKNTHDNRISVEVDSFHGVSIDFCIKLNKYIESRFDREVEDYELEVSSAGLTEPFKVLKQYQKNIGNEVEVITKKNVKISGLLVEANENDFAIEVEKLEKPEGAKRKVIVNEKMTFTYEDIKTTKYIIRFK
jgi:ribosome maturation factor RimP